MLRFHLVQVLDIGLGNGGNLLLMSMDALYTEMFLEFYSRMNLIMMRNLLTVASTGETWKKKRRKKRRKRRKRKNQWKMKTWKMACNLLTPSQALPLAWKHLMSSIFGRHRGKSLKGKQRSNYTRYVLGAQDKAAAKRVDLLKNQKSDRVDVTIQPEELEVMDDVLATKYEEAREEEKLRNQKEDFSDMVAENASKRKRKQEKEGKSKKTKEFKF